MSAAASKPVKLQVNTTGAWRDVIRFDAASDHDCSVVMAAGEALGKVAEAKFRISTNDGDQLALAHWKPGEGWTDHRGRPWK